jgi:hypothetical protein
MASPASHTESEWQFGALDVRPVARWLEDANIPGYGVTEAGTKEVTDTYYDTRLAPAGRGPHLPRSGEGRWRGAHVEDDGGGPGWPARAGGAQRGARR